MATRSAVDSEDGKRLISNDKTEEKVVSYYVILVTSYFELCASITAHFPTLAPTDILHQWLRLDLPYYPEHSSFIKHTLDTQYIHCSLIVVPPSTIAFEIKYT